MSAYAESYSTTFTTADIGKVIDCFAADFDMVAQSTGLRTRENARAVSADVKTIAQHGYLEEVDLCLVNASGSIIRAAKYEISTEAALWTAQRPGNNLWPNTPGGVLQVLVIYSAKWRALSASQKATFEAKLKEPWGTTDIDTSFPGLTRHADRDYVSNGYGARKSIYK
jgi:hypothetical protein